MKKTTKKEPKTVLINISNHPSNKWGEEQKKGMDKIIDIPFPNILPEYNKFDINNLADNIFEKIIKIIDAEPKNKVYIMLQGEYSFCYVLYSKIVRNIILNVENKRFANVVIPITERIVTEEIKEDGSVNKVSVFKFVGWRIL